MTWFLNAGKYLLHDYFHGSYYGCAQPVRDDVTWSLNLWNSQKSVIHWITLNAKICLKQVFCKSLNFLPHRTLSKYINFIKSLFEVITRMERVEYQWLDIKVWHHDSDASNCCQDDKSFWMSLSHYDVISMSIIYDLASYILATSSHEYWAYNHINVCCSDRFNVLQRCPHNVCCDALALAWQNKRSYHKCLLGLE